MTYTYESFGPSGSQSVKWNGIALVGRQGLIILFSIILARLLGPENYGIVAQASVYTTFTALLLDQGITAALVSKTAVTSRLLGAAMSLNLLLSIAMALITIPLALPLASFFQTPELASILPILTIGLLFKGLAVVPRLLLMRQFRFESLAVAEISSALAGGLAGIAGSLLGFEYWAIIIQLLATDLVLVAILLWMARPPLPNVHFGELRAILGFSGRVFIGDILSFASRNADTVLVGRFLGQSQVGYYSLAYRTLLTPIQMVGQTVARVLFPLISRMRDDRDAVSIALLRSTRAIATITFPAMAFVAIASNDLVGLFLGADWLPAAPVLAVLAITGARQAVTSINSPVMLGFGRADIQLRFSAVASVVQVGGIVAGLPFGILGVAIGYTVAGILLTPAIFLIQRHLAGTPIHLQLRSLAASAHASLWAVAMYTALFLLDLQPWVRLLVGLIIGLAAYAGVYRLIHRDAWRAVIQDCVTLVRSRRSPL